MTVLVLYLEGKPVAGAWLFRFGTTAFLHSAASLQEHRRLCPNNLVYWKAIEWACKAGCRALDFCRSREGSGTFHFKKQWGAKPAQIYYQYLMKGGRHMPRVDPHNPKFKLAETLWSKLPLAVANCVGPKLRCRITT